MDTINKVQNINGLLAMTKFIDKMKVASLVHLITKISNLHHEMTHTKPEEA
jgi:hypothetical protein